MPAFVLTLCLLQGAPLLLTAGLVTLTTLPMLFFYRIFMNLLAEQRAEFEKEATRRKQA